jgi:rhamnose transport system substrate-binding protein
MKTIILALTSLAALAVIGCNRDQAAPASTTGAPSAGLSTGKTLRIVFIPKNSGNPYFNEVDRGFSEAAKDFGFAYTTAAPATADATSQIPIIKEQVQRGVDVIAIAANSPDALNPALDEARSRGITIITVDADLVGNETHRDAAILPTNFDDIGSSQVELLGSAIGYEGDFAILSATTDAPTQNAWIAKMKETLAQPKYAKMHLIDTVYGDDEPQKSTTECEALLAKHPGLRGIISPTSVGLAAGAQVVERAGVYPGGPQAKGKGLVLTGLSTPNQLKKFVQKGVVQSFQLWAPYNEGYLAAEIGAQIHDLKLKPAADAAVETKKFGSLKFTKNLELYAGPLQTFDAKNIDTFNF